ncbi:MAG: DUF1127 domain-containing protein [Roseobacter sp.]
MIRTAIRPEFSQTLYQTFVKPAQDLIQLAADLAHKRVVYKQTYIELSRCSDRELEDISIARYDIRKIAREAAQTSIKGNA